MKSNCERRMTTDEKSVVNFRAKNPTTNAIYCFTIYQSNLYDIFPINDAVCLDFENGEQINMLIRRLGQLKKQTEDKFEENTNEDKAES